MHAKKHSDHHRTALEEALRKTRAGFFAVAVFSFFLNLLMLSVPLYMMQVFQRVLSSGQVQTLIYLTLITLFALLILGVLMTLRAWILSGISNWLSAALGGRLIEASLDSALAGGPTGAQPLRDLDEMRGFIGGTGITALFDVPWTPIFLLVIWLLHPLLGYIGVASVVVIFLIAVANELMTRKPTRQAGSEQQRALGFADSSLRNAEVVQAMGMLPDLLQRWLKLNAEAVGSQAVASSRAATMQGLTRFLRFAFQICLMAAAGWLVLQGEHTPGQMIAAVILLGRALAPVDMSITAWRSFVGARAAYGRLQELLKNLAERPPPIVLPPPKGSIHVENVTFTPPGAEKPVLKALSFAIAPGDALGVIGPSAAGKTSLCRLLVGVWAPTVGSVRLDAADVHAYNREEFSRYVGYLPQDVELFAGTVRENIARMGEASDEEIIEAATLADAHDMILRLAHGYDTQIGEGGANISAGQRQRIALARALLRRPRVVVLDEPNSNLDRAGEAALRASLETLRERKTTIVMVVHHANLLQVVDKLALLREGRLVAFGPRNEVLAHLSREEGGERPAPAGSRAAARAAPVLTSAVDAKRAREGES